MNTIDEYQIYTDTKQLPKEYLILKLKMTFNKDLLDKKIISFDIYSKMQNILMRRMNKIILNIEKQNI